MTDQEIRDLLTELHRATTHLLDLSPRLRDRLRWRREPETCTGLKLLDNETLADLRCNLSELNAFCEAVRIESTIAPLKDRKITGIG